ncbi:MAG: type II toxin-antitoxin system PemK/MazF family toxin [Chloroflexota bacterium]|nr:type II toxin-antitoxin system PemK/MazF family toxin [Chloroflexota bacterium]
MAAFVKGEVVVLPFPYTDLSTTKRRPALIVAVLDRNDVILCPITTQVGRDRDAILLASSDFQHGSLQQKSSVRPDHLLTADEGLILYRVGAINPTKMAEVTAALVRILTR